MISFFESNCRCENLLSRHTFYKETSYQLSIEHAYVAENVGMVPQNVDKCVIFKIIF